MKTMKIKTTVNRLKIKKFSKWLMLSCPVCSQDNTKRRVRAEELQKIYKNKIEFEKNLECIKNWPGQHHFTEMLRFREKDLTEALQKLLNRCFQMMLLKNDRKYEQHRRLSFL